MKRFAVILFSLGALAPRLFAQTLTVTNGDIMTFNGSSYDTDGHAEGVTFGSFFPLMFPTRTNYFYTVSRSGESWPSWWQSEEEKWGLPLWAQGIGQTVQIRNVYDADDNGGLVSNTVVEWGTNIANAPGLFNNGAAPTNEGYSFPMTFLFTGNPPHDSSDGDSGAVSRNAGSLTLNALLGTPAVDQWNLDWTNGWSNDVVSSRLLGFSDGSHPYQGGFVVMSIQRLRALGADTNVGSVLFDWTGVSATTSHATVTSLAKVGLALSCTINFDRMPMGYLTQSGNVTNDGNNAFIAEPSLGNAFNWIIQGTNFVSGNTYLIFVDGVLVDTPSGAQLNAGRNWFTNNIGPLWLQRVAVVNALLDLYGFDHTNFVSTHDAGTGGVLGFGDMKNYFSHASQFYDTDGHRGAQYVTDMAPSVADLNKYVAAVYTAAQPTNHTFSIIGLPPRVAPFHR